ncbi:unnamed protein product [Rodentolepis nana]|uniref:Uncharacterized protein n=1 Tax=Rodentolepis nana TaxID=102285 RepID=A0A0R3TCS5_RODNA|nr:unnamed protein product [Rodentolepis nana]
MRQRIPAELSLAMQHLEENATPEQNDAMASINASTGQMKPIVRRIQRREIDRLHRKCANWAHSRCFTETGRTVRGCGIVPSLNQMERSNFESHCQRWRLDGWLVHSLWTPRKDWPWLRHHCDSMVLDAFISRSKCPRLDTGVNNLESAFVSSTIGLIFLSSYWTLDVSHFCGVQMDEKRQLTLKRQNIDVFSIPT